MGWMPRVLAVLAGGALGVVRLRKTSKPCNVLEIQATPIRDSWHAFAAEPRELLQQACCMRPLSVQRGWHNPTCGPAFDDLLRLAGDGVLYVSIRRPLCARA